jgi:hypothetical protein
MLDVYSQGPDGGNDHRKKSNGVGEGERERVYD